MSDFAALLEAAKFEDKETDRAAYTGPIDPVVVKIVDKCLNDGQRATIPVPNVDVFNALGDQLRAEALKRNKSAHITKVWENKGEENEKLTHLRVGIGEKRGAKGGENKGGSGSEETRIPAQAAASK